MPEITTIEILTILALIAGPALAVWMQKRDERRREHKSRQLYIFHVLMATRANRLSIAHVEALNSIDIDFSKKKKKEKPVITAWSVLLDQFEQTLDNTREEGFNELLFQMSKCLGFDFEKIEIKNRCYSPIGHAEEENTNRLIREGLVKFLDDNPLDVNIKNIPEKELEELGEGLTKLIKGH